MACFGTNAAAPAAAVVDCSRDALLARSIPSADKMIYALIFIIG